MTRGEGSAFGGYGWFTALVHNSHGRYRDALDAATRACEHEDVIYYGWALVELIEAGVRSDHPTKAAAALERLSERTHASGTEWALGIEARCRGLVRDDERGYVESIERLASSRATVELARSRLLYGEWLRREHRRVDARDQLRTAYEAFSRIGANAFAQRARGELLATGEKAASAPTRPVTRSPLRRRGSPSLRATSTPTPRSRHSCSSVRARSNITCTRCSRSSASARANSFARRCAPKSSRS